MSNLRSRIEEEHLTCSICYNTFRNPKALPCLHTFCEHCLREYVVSRGYELAGQFPCPMCRVEVPVPSGGIEQFPDNHLVKSLSHTVDNVASRPIPKPRKSLQPQTETKKAEALHPKAVEAGETAVPPCPPSDLPPSYSAATGFDAASSASPAYFGRMDGAGPHPSQQPHNLPPYPCPSHPASTTMGYYPPAYLPAPVNTTPYPAPSTTAGAHGMGLQVTTISGTPSPAQQTGPVLYPTIPPNFPTTTPTVCSEGLQLQFGKKGASITDFNKPLGLAVSDSCDFVVTDTSNNRIFVFDYSGHPKKAFQCDCRIRDVCVNARNEILVVVNKPGAVLRCYDMSGRLLGEHGKSITHEESVGVAALYSGGAVITGKQNHSVYILTDQYKLSSKFGRKGAGDGYFQSPAFVATDSHSHVIVTDDVNHNIQVFSNQGKFKLRFGSKGSDHGQLFHPRGITTDAEDNIIVADSGNYRVEMFTHRGGYLRTIVSTTDRLGEDVRPVNVAMTPKGHIAVLLKGNYFAEVRVYSPFTACHTPESVKETSTWYLVN